MGISLDTYFQITLCGDVVGYKNQSQSYAGLFTFIPLTGSVNVVVGFRVVFVP